MAQNQQVKARGGGRPGALSQRAQRTVNARAGRATGISGGGGGLI